MPKKEIQDYIFYKITCLDDTCELCYVGSTANWKERQRCHKNRCTNENGKNYNLKVYKTIRANGGWDNFNMIEIGTRPQLTLRRAKQIEEEYRVKLKASMNDIRCYRSEEQKRENNKERNKNWTKDNKDKIKVRVSQKIVCECGCEVTKSSLSRHKKSQKHIEFIELVQNKDNIKANTIDKVVCECGCQIRKRDGLTDHKKTKKHIRLMELLQN